MKRILTKLEIYTLAEEHPCRKGSRGWRLLTQESKVWVTKRQEGVKGVSLSLKDTWQSAFPSAVFPGNPGWASQQRCPSIKGFSFNTQTLSQSRTVKQAQSFNTHLLLPQASRVAALPSGGFGSLFCAHSLSPQQGWTGNPLTGAVSACGQPTLVCSTASKLRECLRVGGLRNLQGLIQPPGASPG